MLRVMAILSFPRIAKLFRLSFLDDEPLNFFVDIIRQRMTERRNEVGFQRRSKDLIDLSVEALRGIGTKFNLLNLVPTVIITYLLESV